MSIRKFSSLNENMGYKTIFGKEVSHEEALQKRIRSLVIHIIMEERGISEKSFRKIDEVIKEVDDIFNKNMNLYDDAQQYYESGKRLQWLAEQIYYEYFKK